MPTLLCGHNVTKGLYHSSLFRWCRVQLATSFCQYCTLFAYIQSHRDTVYSSLPRPAHWSAQFDIICQLLHNSVIQSSHVEQLSAVSVSSYHLVCTGCCMAGHTFWATQSVVSSIFVSIAVCCMLGHSHHLLSNSATQSDVQQYLSLPCGRCWTLYGGWAQSLTSPSICLYHVADAGHCMVAQPSLWHPPVFVCTICMVGHLAWTYGWPV